MSGFKLTDQELDNAFSAINHHGYSAMLPEPFEWQEVQNNWKDIKNTMLERYKKQYQRDK